MRWHGNGRKREERVDVVQFVLVGLIFLILVAGLAAIYWPQLVKIFGG